MARLYPFRNHSSYAFTLSNAVLPAVIAPVLSISSMFRFFARRAKKRNIERRKSTAAETTHGAPRNSCQSVKSVDVCSSSIVFESHDKDDYLAIGILLCSSTASTAP